MVGEGRELGVNDASTQGRTFVMRDRQAVYEGKPSPPTPMWEPVPHAPTCRQPRKNMILADGE